MHDINTSRKLQTISTGYTKLTMAKDIPFGLLLYLDQDWHVPVTDVVYVEWQLIQSALDGWETGIT